MLTVKYILLILFHLTTELLGDNGLRLKTSLGNLKNVNLETLLELHKDNKAGRIFKKDGSFNEPPQKNTAISRLVFLVDVINEILNEGLSDKENEVLSNVISIHGNGRNNKFNEKNVTQELLNLVFKKEFNIPDFESDDVNKGTEPLEKNVNTNPYLLSSNEKTNKDLILPGNPNPYYLSKERSKLKETSSIGLNRDFKPMENKWQKLLNESLRIMESKNEKDLRTVEPVMDHIVNKNLMSSDFKIHQVIDQELINKEKNLNTLLDKGYPKKRSVSNNTEKSYNIKITNIGDLSDDDENIDIELFEDIYPNASSVVGPPDYRRRLKISSKDIMDYRRDVNALKKIKKQRRPRKKKERVRRYLDDNDDPNYNEDDYFWEPSPMFTRRIFQGIPVRITDFPFMASIHMFQTLQCSGAIIKSDLVLTAASCLQIAWNNRFFRENPRFLQVRVGSTRFFGGGEVIEVAEVYFHPHYKPKTLTSNLAIIRLFRNLRFSNTTSNYVLKIKIDREDHRIPENNEPVTLIGFGAVRPSNTLHAKGFGKLQYAILPLYPYGDCRDMYSKEYVTKYNFCAGLMAIGSGACNHDVGDPGISDGRVIGVVSFGSPICGRTDTPTVFTKVGMFKKWIDEIVMIEPVVYLHRYSTTPDPVPLEPIAATKHRGSGRNKQMALAKGKGAKLSNDGSGKTRRPFKVRPMTKTVDVLEYFPADDPLKLGNTKKRKLRMGLKRPIVAQQPEMPDQQLTGGFQTPPPSGSASLPFGVDKIPFGMEQPPSEPRQPKIPFGMDQPPLDGMHQPKIPFGMEQPPLDGMYQPKVPFGMEQTPLDAMHQPKIPFGMEPLDAMRQPQIPFGMQHPSVGGNQQQQYGLGNQQQYGGGNQQQAGGGLGQGQFGVGQYGQPSGKNRKQPSRAMVQQNNFGALNSPLLQPPLLSTSSSVAIARTPALSMNYEPTAFTTTINGHDFIPAECNESDVEGTGTHAKQCNVAAAAAAMPLTATRAGDVVTNSVDYNIQFLEGNGSDEAQARADARALGLKLTNANSEAIDDENKVSALIETIFEPGMQADIRQGVTEADNQQDGDKLKKLKDIDKSIMSMLYVTDKEDNNNKERSNTNKKDDNINKDDSSNNKEEDNINKEDKTNIENISEFKDYKVPRGEGLAVPDDVEIIDIEEPNEFRFRAADDSNENRDNVTTTIQEISDEGGNALNPGVTMEDEVTNVPRYREDTEPPEGYYLDENPQR